MRSDNQPSNALYRNEVVSFPEALRLYVAQYEQEARLFPDQPVLTLDDARSQAAQARAIYQHCIDQAVAQMRQSGLDQFADALEEGDYSRLAL